MGVQGRTGNGSTGGRDSGVSGGGGVREGVGVGGEMRVSGVVDER